MPFRLYNAADPAIDAGFSARPLGLPTLESDLKFEGSSELD